jgi:hypothetical protein
MTVSGTRNFLFVVSSSLGELDTHLPLFVRARKDEGVATTVLFTRPDLFATYRRSAGYATLEREGIFVSGYYPLDPPLPPEINVAILNAAAGFRGRLRGLFGVAHPPADSTSRMRTGSPAAAAVPQSARPSMARKIVSGVADAVEFLVHGVRLAHWRAQRFFRSPLDLTPYQFISVEFEGGTASFDYFRAHCKRTATRLFAHHHALSTNETMPSRYLEREFDATGISTYASEANTALFRAMGVNRMVQIGCTKFFPEWLERVESIPFPPLGHGHVVLFLKKLHRAEFRAMTDHLLDLLAHSFPELEVVIKVHPREPIAAYRKHARARGLASAKVVFEPNFLVLRGALCAVSLPGTAIVDSYAHGVPCIEYHQPYDPASGYAPVTQDSRRAGFPAVDRIEGVAAFIASCRARTWPLPPIVGKLQQIPAFRLFT